MDMNMSTSARKTRRNNTDPETTRQEILQAALEVLAKDGAENLSVTEVARRAGVNRGTAYQHFPTRQDLVHATAAWVSDRMYEEFYGDVNELQERKEPYPPDVAQERLSNFAMNSPELSQAWLFDVMTTEGEVTDPFWKEYVQRLQGYADEGYARKDIDVEVFAFVTLVGSLLWPIWVGAHSKGAKSRKKMQQRFCDEMMRMVLFGSLEPERHSDLVQRYGKGA
jgi:AcrR family transcriptional regulator